MKDFQEYEVVEAGASPVVAAGRLVAYKASTIRVWSEKATYAAKNRGFGGGLVCGGRCV